MIGSGCTGKVRLVTPIAGSWRVYVVVVRMALRAGHRRVHSGKRIVRKSGVVKFRI